METLLLDANYLVQISDQYILSLDNAKHLVMKANQ